METSAPLTRLDEPVASSFLVAAGLAMPRAQWVDARGHQRPRYRQGTFGSAMIGRQVRPPLQVRHAN